MWALNRGLVGIGFNPDQLCTRLQAVSFLYKIGDSPTINDYDLRFADVDSNDLGIVIWAVKIGVTNGTGRNEFGEDIFSPDATCTRAQIVTFLYRYYVESLIGLGVDDKDFRQVEVKKEETIDINPIDFGN